MSKGFLDGNTYLCLVAMLEKTPQEQFAANASAILALDDQVIGLAVGGSWLTNDLDEFSDLDLVLVTETRIAGDTDRMMAYAARLGKFLSGFTGEHVGEPRLLICLYDEPLLHVDIKFLTLEEFYNRVETPTLLLDKGKRLSAALANSVAQFPYPDFQWIEDRFWTWIHYALLKIGRGEYLEACDFLGFLRMVVLGPLLHMKNGSLPRGVRKVETTLDPTDLNLLKQTIASYDRQQLLKSLRRSVALYNQLRIALYGPAVKLQESTEQKVMSYFDFIEKRS